MNENTSKTFDSERIGGLFFIGLPCAELDSVALNLLRNIRPGGICLFARNIKTPEQVRELTDSIRAELGADTLISIDQEGGRVDRLRRILEPMPAVSQLRDADDIRHHADYTARALLNLGINMNFAPVVDVDGPGRDFSTNGLATRVYGSAPRDVVGFAETYIRNLSNAGIKTCLKHFPGLGASKVDSHEELPVVDVSLKEFEEADLVPYKRIELDAGSTAVMVAHAAYSGNPLQGSTADGKPIPSSIGGGFISALLRQKYKFDGVVVTDDLEMGAILKHFGIAEASLMALEAGNDQLLICNDGDNILRAFEAVNDAAASGRIAPDAIDVSLRRIGLMKDTLHALTHFDVDLFDSLAEEIKLFKSRLA